MGMKFILFLEINLYCYIIYVIYCFYFGEQEVKALIWVGFKKFDLDLVDLVCLEIRVFESLVKLDVKIGLI